jgi:hypothetical protein
MCCGRCPRTSFDLDGLPAPLHGALDEIVCGSRG